MIDFKLPSLGADMDEGTLLTWQVKPGDAVKRGQVVAVVDTSKAAVDVEIWEDGVVAELLVQTGEKVPVGTVLARLLAPGEMAAPAGAPAPATGPLSAPAALPQPVTPQVRETPQPTVTTRQPVSPAARKRVKELGLDPDRITGSGPQGAVTLADVEAAAGRVTPEPPPSAPDRQRHMRKAIAAAMSRSKREIPHYYLSDTVPMAASLAWLQQRNEGVAITERILPAVLLLHAVAVALRRTPQLNGFYRDGEFQPSTAVHAGVAISLRGGGLVAPAIHDVGAKPLLQLMHELADLVRRARAGSLRSSEMSDPTLTVTNLGEQSVETVFGVIYPPQVALVGFGRLAARPWVQDGKVCAVPLLTATLAADHRASDGHQGAIFLAELRELLQQPQTLADTTTSMPNREASQP